MTTSVLSFHRGSSDPAGRLGAADSSRGLQRTQAPGAMSEPSVLVFVEQKPMAGRIVPVTPGSVIGRDACDVVLPDPEVSRKHAVVRNGAHGPTIQDLGSLNGTFVNGHR